jgi:hypothetical protein
MIEILGGDGYRLPNLKTENLLRMTLYLPRPQDEG